MTLLQRLLHFFRSFFAPAPVRELEPKSAPEQPAKGEPVIQSTTQPTMPPVKDNPPMTPLSHRTSEDVPRAVTPTPTHQPTATQVSMPKATTSQPEPKPVFTQTPKPVVEEKPLRPLLDEAAIAQLSKATFEKMGGQIYVVCPACQAKVNQDAVLRDHRAQKSAQGIVWKCRVCQTDMLVPFN